MDPTGRKSVHVEVKDRSHVWCRYTTQTQVHYTRNSWRKLVTHLQEIVSGDLNAHVGNDAQVWKGVIGKHGDDNLNYNGSLLYCAPWALFSNREIHKYTVVQKFVGSTVTHRFLYRFRWLVPCGVESSCQKAAGVSTDQLLVVWKLRLVKQTLLSLTCKTSGRPWWTRM